MKYLPIYERARISVVLQDGTRMDVEAIVEHHAGPARGVAQAGTLVSLLIPADEVLRARSAATIDTVEVKTPASKQR